MLTKEELQALEKWKKSNKEAYRIGPDGKLIRVRETDLKEIMNDIAQHVELNGSCVSGIRDCCGACKIIVNSADSLVTRFTPKNIIFNPPATVVFWKDGTKTVVKCAKDATYSPYYGFLAALAKKIFKSNNFINNLVDKYAMDAIKNVIKPIMKENGGKIVLSNCISKEEAKALLRTNAKPEEWRKAIAKKVTAKKSESKPKSKVPAKKTEVKKEPVKK